MAILLHELVGSDPARPFSPHCWKVRLALRHKGLDFHTVPVPFTGVPKIEGGSGIVPVLRDGDTVVSDSFAIAEYLETAYPDAPSLFGGEGGRRLSRFVESWSQRTIHPVLGGFALLDIHDALDPADQAYFRESRETRMGKPLEAVVEGREQRLASFLQQLEPLRAILAAQPFLGGESPLFADYIVFGAFQWLRVSSPFAVLPAGDPISAWFERCLDLHEGEGRRVPAAA
ncbi:glutathione S-transferase family protein [Aurantimonas sp. HBX-1]|uniref:glutathione S-transferase family protein n=1 Tax=Aurantimonas sp. HBX-1 TaxID=2906072 RepID=UPI001F397062|nr:glutathione S-transferase family protein [Aurantimonas sp. HBX-1]UIJ70285.1 glutathione S-transferase family protein [Aurantimonas sp. HBX-1]